MRDVVLLPETIFAELSPRIAEIAPRLLCVPYAENDAPVDTADAVAVLRWVGGNRFASLVAHGANIRWLHTASAGVDHVLTPAVLQKCAGGTLTLTDSGPAFGIAIGEFVLAWMLAASHRLYDLREAQAAHRWQSVKHEELFAQTAGIIGLGPIGQGIAERCRAFGMRTVGLRRTQTASPFVDDTRTGADGLASLLRESDWVIVAAALTGETRSLLGASELAQMKPTARLVNIARGGLVDEPALVAALQNGTIAGACLDVFAAEPLSAESPLWDMPNVYIAPHNSSGWADGLRRRQQQLFLENVARFAVGEPLAGVVDVARGY